MAAAPQSGAGASRAHPDAAELRRLSTEILEVLLENDDANLATSLDELERRLAAHPEDVSAAVDELASDGTVRVRGHLLRLTQDGRDLAFRRVRRHRLTARLLSDVIGLPWWKVHRAAAEWEHLVSDEVERRILDLLDDPGTCPHGNPIPGSANRMEHPDAMLLEDAPLGPCRVLRVSQALADDEALQLLELSGFVPGSHGEVRSRRDGWVEVAGAVRDGAIPPYMARHIVVAPR